jgi:hypothetical protein
MRVKRGAFSVNRAVEPAGHYGDVCGVSSPMRIEAPLKEAASSPMRQWLTRSGGAPAIG